MTESGAAPPALSLAGIGFALLAPGPSAEGAEAEWLNRYARAAEASQGTPAEQVARWSREPPEGDRQLHALAGMLRTSPVETLGVALAVAVETDPMAGRALSFLQHPAGGGHPTVGLLVVAASRFDPASRTSLLAALAEGPARESGVLRIDPGGRPLPDAPMRIDVPLVLALNGHRSRWPGVEVGFPEAPPLPGSLLARARRHASAFGEHHRTLLLRARHPREARAAAQVLARELGLEAAFVDGEPPQGLGPWAWLTGRLPVVMVEAAPGEHRGLRRLPGYGGPMVVMAGLDGGYDVEGEPLPVWQLAVPEPRERVELWLDATGDPEASTTLGHDQRHGPWRIHTLARAGRIQARVAGEEPDLGHILAAGRGGAAADLGALAEPLPEAIHEDALVLPPSIAEELDALVRRCSGRDALVHELGPAARARFRAGVRALLYGPSGTGKTLAVGWLATRLGLPLYRVDLANVTSKYIGETEKNLSQLFARAEHAEVVLMFDEADALFGKRTDVKDSNDRYANAQTNYLLQRIESFEGIAVLTSNSRARFDSAFARRLDVIIEFPLPTPDDRRKLWRAHLGSAHDLSSTDLNRLSAGCDLAGGHLRNAVLAAASRARGEGRPPTYRDVVYGVALEYRKLGRQLPSALGRGNGAGSVLPR